ncbi:MAG: hypothetical protein MUE34_13750 [Acidimicrobiales bacterium]|nr:hypothetical protein [Acidimicrobiales bacterium]
MQHTEEVRPVRTSIRAECPDGTAVEYVREDDGRIVRLRWDPTGAVLDRVAVLVAPDGGCTVTRIESDGVPTGPVDPEAVATRTNAYGLLVEQARYGSGLVVEHAFDDETRLREVTVRGPWGAQTTELRADGSRTVRWHTPLLEGQETWDATGIRSSWEVTCVDVSLTDT